MKSAKDWCEEMFSRGNWVIADEVTIRAIQADALEDAKVKIGEQYNVSREAKFDSYKSGVNDGLDISEQVVQSKIDSLK